MGATTPLVGLRYPVLGDAPAIPQDLQNLADDIENLGLAAHCVFAYRSSGDGDSGPIASGSAGVIQYPSELFDTDGYHSTTSVITIPAGLGGYYLVGASARWDSQGGGNIREIFLDVNLDGKRLAGQMESLSTANPATFPTGTVVQQSVVGFAHLAAGDTLHCNFNQDSGSGIVIKQSGYTPNLWAVRLPIF